MASGHDAAVQATLPPRLRLVVTEYNMMERAGPLKLSWAHGLFVASMALNMLAVPQLDAALMHVLLNGFGWGALYCSTNDFVAGSGRTPPGSQFTGTGKIGCLIPECQSLTSKIYSLTAVGTALSAIAGSMQTATFVEEVGSDAKLFRNPTISGGVRPDGMSGAPLSYPSLLAFRFTTAGGTEGNLTVLNVGAKHLSFNGSTSSSFTTWSSPLRTDTGGADVMAWASQATPVRVRHGTVGAAEGVALPPYSITRISLKTDDAPINWRP